MSDIELYPLPNLKNNCFINVCLQSLLSCEDFSKEIQNADEWKELFDEKIGKISHDRSGLVSSLMKFFHDNSEDYDVGDQADAAEFLNFLIDSMNSKFQKFSIQAQMIEKVKGKVSVKIEDENILYLSVRDNFEDSLAEFHMEMTDTHFIRRPFKDFGNYLFICVKRFRNDRSKIETPMTFTNQINIMDSTGQRVGMRLVGIIVHIILGKKRRSNVEIGHYVFFRKINDEVWYLMDDETVEEIDTYSVENSEDGALHRGYIYLYERIIKKGEETSTIRSSQSQREEYDSKYHDIDFEF